MTLEKGKKLPKETADAIASAIKEWSVAIVSNTDVKTFIDFKGGSKKGERANNADVQTYKVQIGNEIIELGCSVRNQQLLREGEYYLISKNLLNF